MKIKKTIYLFLIITITAFTYIFFESELSGVNELKSKEDRISGAYDALNFWTMARAYPGDDIPNVARMQLLNKQS